MQNMLYSTNTKYVAIIAIKIILIIIYLNKYSQYEFNYKF